MWTPEKYQKAIIFAAEKHQGQLIPGSNLPYIVHVSNVCMEVFLAGITNSNFNMNLAMQCALLHDVIEDTTTTYEELQNLFGTEVADGVKALSKNSGLEKKMQMMESIVRIKQQPHEIWVVKMADRITNLQEPPKYWSPEKIIYYKEEAQLIVEQLAGANQYVENRLRTKINQYQIYIN